MFALSDIERLVTFDRAGVGHLSRALIRTSWVSVCVSVMELGWSVRVVRGDGCSGSSESECSALSVCGPRRKGLRVVMPVRDFARVEGVAAKPLH